MKAFHISDEHAREKDLDQVIKSCKAILTAAEIERPDLIVSAGDLFDSRDIRLDTETVKFMFKWIKDLAEIAPVAIVSGTPTHDGNTVEALRQIPGVWVSTKPEQIFLDNQYSWRREPFSDPPFAIISMTPTPTKQFFQGADEDIAQAMTGIFAGFGAQASEFDCAHILVGHFAVKGAAISDTQVMTGREIEIGRDQIELANADVVCLGHIHKSQKIGDNIFYAGSIYPLNFGETEDKGFYVHELSLHNCPLVDSRFIILPTRKLFNVKMDFTGDDEFSVNDFESIMNFCYSKDHFQGKDIKAVLKAYQDEAATIDRQKIENFYKAAGAESVTIQIINVPRETVRSERLLTLSSLRDKVQEMATLNGESVVASILEKADMIETMKPEDVLKYVQSTEFGRDNLNGMDAAGPDMLDVPELQFQRASNE